MREAQNVYQEVQIEQETLGEGSPDMQKVFNINLDIGCMTPEQAAEAVKEHFGEIMNYVSGELPDEVVESIQNSSYGG